MVRLTYRVTGLNPLLWGTGAEGQPKPLDIRDDRATGRQPDRGQQGNGGQRADGDQLDDVATVARGRQPVHRLRVC
jgi:hypothetical protein